MRAWGVSLGLVAERKHRPAHKRGLVIASILSKRRCDIGAPNHMFFMTH